MGDPGLSKLDRFFQIGDAQQRDGGAPLPDQKLRNRNGAVTVGVRLDHRQNLSSTDSFFYLLKVVTERCKIDLRNAGGAPSNIHFLLAGQHLYSNFSGSISPGVFLMCGFSSNSNT